jgi:type I restriction enzyme S subunit
MNLVRLGELVSVTGGGTPRKGVAAYYDGDIPWVTPKDMKARVIAGSSVRITQSGMGASPAKLVPAGSVLVVVRSGVLKHTLPVGLTTVPVTLNQDMKALTPGPFLDSSYLAHLLTDRAAEVLSWVRATTADNFPIAKLLDLELRLPPIEEQRRIAAILDHADALQQRLKRRVEELSSLESALFCARFGADEANAMVVEVAADIRTGPFGSQLLHGEFVDQGVAVLGLDNVVTNEFRWVERRFITSAKYDQLKRYTVHAGDVLISIMGTVGRCVVVPGDIPLAINTKHICAITPQPELAFPEFLRAAFLWHPESRAYLRGGLREPS